MLRALSLVLLILPQKGPWGRSSLINQSHGPKQQEGLQSLEIEMQSGDVIEIQATGFSCDRVE